MTKLDFISFALHPINKQTWLSEFIVLSFTLAVLIVKFPLPIEYQMILVGIGGWFSYSLIKTRKLMVRIK